MLTRLKKARKGVAILLVVASLSILVPIKNNTLFSMAAQEVRVTNVPSMVWGGFGQYVEYELNGKSYRTDTAPSHINRQAFSLMSQEDKRKTYDRLFTTSARKAAFGEDGWQDIVDWIRETNEWFIANREWKNRVAKKNFPNLHSIYDDGQSLASLSVDYKEMKEYIIPPIVPESHMTRQEFSKGLEETESYYNIGREYYNKVKDMRGKNIGKAMSFTMMQCTQMLSSMLFLPSVSNMASMPTSGLIADTIGVLQSVLSLEGTDLADKLNDALDGKAVHLSVGEQIKLHEAMIETYAQLADRYYKEANKKIASSKNLFTSLRSLAEDLEQKKIKASDKKDKDRNAYIEALSEVIVIPKPNPIENQEEEYSEEDIAFIRSEIERIYNLISDEVEGLEAESSAMNDKYSDLRYKPELFRIYVDGRYFTGYESFTLALDKFSSYYGELQYNIKENKNQTEELIEEVGVLKDGYESWYDGIKANVKNLTYNIALLESLNKESPVSNLKVNIISVNRPKNAYNMIYEIYQGLSDLKDELDIALEDSSINETRFNNEKNLYHIEMKSRLDLYLKNQDKKNEILGQIKTIVAEYEELWKATYFTGFYDYNKYQPYLYDGLMPVLSAFDIAALREHIRAGGNKTIIINKLKDITEKAKVNEVIVPNLIGEFKSLDMEMKMILDDDLRQYAAYKNEDLHNLTQISTQDIPAWHSLDMDPDSILFYFNIHDIPTILEILSGRSRHVEFLEDSIKEIRKYLDASRVDIYSTSNRLYDIYREATRIKEFYGMGDLSKSLMTDSEIKELRAKISNLYASANDDDIYNNINEIKLKHKDINISSPPSRHEGVDYWNPVGGFAHEVTRPGSIDIKAPISHELAATTSQFYGQIYMYNNGWTQVATISERAKDVIDKEEDLLNIQIQNLESGKEYRLDWKITYTPNFTAITKEGKYPFTYYGPEGIFVSSQIDEETYDRADISIFNNSKEDLLDRDIQIDGYDYEGKFVTSKVEVLNLPQGKNTNLQVEFDDAIYRVEVRIDGVEIQDPSYFEDWPKKPDKPVDKFKDWSIKFSSKVDEASVTAANIYIKDSNGKKLDISPELDVSGLIIKLDPPLEGYEEGAQYTLYIGKNVRGENGKNLSKGIKMKFDIE